MHGEPAVRSHPVWLTATLAALHAVLFAAAFPPVGLWPLVLVAPAPLAWLAIRARGAWSAALVVTPVQWLMWLWMMRWLVDVTVVGYLVLAFYLSLYATLLVWIVRRLRSWPPTARWPMTALLPLIWVGLECLRGLLAFDGYPWFLLAHPLVEWTPLAQSADLLGSFFVSGLAATVSGWLIDLALARSGELRVRRAVAAGLALVVVHGANVGYGLWRSRPVEGAASIAVAVVQTNLPQDNKIGWPRDRWWRDVQDAVELSREVVERNDALDLLIWPETMLPGLGLEPGTLSLIEQLGLEPQRQILDAVLPLPAELGVPLLLGSSTFIDLAVEREPEPRLVWERQHNSAYLVRERPPYQRYDKQFLTPFGEVMPYISSWPWLEQKLLSLGARGMSFSLDEGPELVRLRLTLDDGTLVIGTPICFEDTVPVVCRRMVHDDGRKLAGALVNLSNDGWFGDFDGGRWRHNQIARYRCIENRVPMVRAVNTGQSVAIDSAGNVIARVGPGRYGTARRAGFLAVELPLDDRRTLYGRFGDLWAWACLVVSTLLFAGTLVRRGAGPPNRDP